MKNTKWDLTEFYKNNDEFITDCDKFEKELKTIVKKYKGNIMNDAKTLYNFLQESDKLDKIIDHIYSYAKFLFDLDITNNESQKINDKATKLVEKYYNELAFVKPEILKGNYKKFIKENPELKEYEFYLEKLFRTKTHTLSPKEEIIISKATNALGLSDDIFTKLDNADINLGFIKDENGKKQELTNANYSNFVKSKDKRVRKDAFIAMYKYYGSLKHTLATNYLGQIKEDFFYSEIRKYKNPLAKSLFGDNIDSKVYKNLVESVHKGLPVIHKYFELKKKILGLKEMHMYDVYVTPNQLVDKYSYEDAKSIVIEALKPLGKEYIETLTEAFTNKWIDVYPNKGKKSGAYCSSFCETHPYVLLNYTDTLNDVSTLAHEMGHAMHTYYSKKHQPYQYYWYGIFLAEIASTVNEVLLSEYMIKKSKNCEEKLSLIFDFMEKSRATFYRQTMFAEFEYIVHEKYEKNEPLTTDELCNIYYDLNKTYFGKHVKIDEEIKYEWSRIPHFYSPFYVYKYATGITCAFDIATRILNNEEGLVEKYLNFLSSGSSKYPLDILKELGIDLTKFKPFKNTITIFERRLMEIEKLINFGGETL